jgi:HAE1 family hydrophobic/amphiphilic exporter-1
MFMISCIVILLGLISLTRLPVDLLPDVSQPTVTVNVGYPGVGPLEMEELVTRPLEGALSATSGVEQITSQSSEGRSQVRLNFAWGMDLNEAMNDMRTRLDRVRNRLPEDADPPTMFKFDPNQQPIMGIGVEATGNYDRVTLREVAENVLSQRFERVPGVAQVQINGGLRRQIHVELTREKIMALDLSVDRVVNILRTENQNIPIGEINQGDRTYLLRSSGQFQNLDEIRDLVVQTKTGVPVYLKDIADVKDSTEDIRSFLRINGKPGVRLQITKQSGTNTVQIAQLVRKEIEKTNREVPGVKLLLLEDNAKYIERSIGAVREHVMIGSGLVILVIFLFLRNFRSTLIVATSIPISVIGTFALLYFAGMTLNTMTFGGLALGVGMVVDAAIVVLENSFRHMEEHGKDRLTAAIEGSEEVWSAILASILTHIAVFVPLMFLTGISSVMFVQLSIVVCFSLAMSLFVAVTLVPVLCSRLLVLPAPPELRKGISGRLYTLSDRWLKGMDEGYRRLLHLALNHRPTVVAAAAASVAIGLLILPTIPSEFSTQTDEGQVNVQAELPIGTRIERTDAVLTRLEQMIPQLVPEMESLIANANGGGGQNNFGGQSNRGQVNIFLVPKDQRKRSSEQIAIDLRRALSGIPGVVIRANASGGNNQINRFLSGGGQGGGRLSLEIRGEDLADARALALRAKAMMDNVPGIADARVGRDEGRPELAVLVDRPKAALLGLTSTNVANTIRTNVAGTQAALFRDHGNEYPIIVRLRESDRQQVSDVQDVLISAGSGQVLQAKNLMSVANETGPVQIDRKNQQRITTVSAEPETTLSDAVEAVQNRIPQLAMPKDFNVGFGSEVEEQAKAFNQLRMVLILALVLVYAVMASQYESLRDPFIIMFSVPTAIVGIVLALKLTGTAFNMQAYIGIIMLAGIVVSNGILLVDYTNVLRRRDGLPLREAVELAGRTRLRPILMTSIATMLGLVPMSLGLGEGSELQVPLARVVIGGLLTSLLITLVLVPTVYTIFEEGWSGLWRRGKHAEAAARS